VIGRLGVQEPEATTTHAKAESARQAEPGMGEHLSSTAPSTTARARADASACGALARPLRWGVGAGVPRHPSHGLRIPLLPHPPRGGPGAFQLQQARPARLSLHFGSRGRAVQKPRFMPLRTAQAVARQLQARHIGLVAVL